MKHVNQLYLLFCLLFMSNASKAQFVYSDLFSHARGNQAMNITVGNTHGLFYWAMGIDGIYKINGVDRKIAPGISGALVAKLGLTHGGRWWRINYGVQQMYSKIHEYHLDYSLIEKYRYTTYDKTHNKYTILGFFEFEINLSKHIFLGFQTAAGSAIITFTSLKEVSPQSGLRASDRFIDFSGAYHHVEHYNYDDVHKLVALRLGLHLGYRF